MDLDLGVAKWVTEVEEPLSFGRRPVETTSLGARYDLPAPGPTGTASSSTPTPSGPRPGRRPSNADGRPHAAAVGALFVEGAWWFTSGRGSRKSRDLLTNPRCSVSTATATMDLTVEGRAERITDPEVLRRMAAVYSSQGWPAAATDEGLTAEYSAP